jgi:hypothetical protein
MMQKNIRLVSFIILGVKGNCISIIHRSVFCRVRMRTKVAYTLSTAAGQLRWPLQTDLSQNIILHTAQFVLYPIPTRTFILRHRAVCVCVCVCVCARAFACVRVCLAITGTSHLLNTLVPSFVSSTRLRVSFRSVDELPLGRSLISLIYFTKRSIVDLIVLVYID